MEFDITNIVPKEYYYNQSKIISKDILKNIEKSSLQEKYREYMAKYRNIDKRVLGESYMFYILDGEDEFDEIIPSLVDRDILGIQSGSFIKQTLRFVFPILNHKKIIVGWVGYDYEEEKYKYLKTLTKFTEKGRLFFNWHNIHKCYDKDICIIVEGVFDSLRLNEAGFYNNLGLLGKKITDYQARVLNRFDLVILVPDNDDPGVEAYKWWLKKIKTKRAVIKIDKEKFIKRRAIGDDLNERESVVKDIDDCLQIEGKKEKFKEIYKKINKDALNPFYDVEFYRL